MSFPRDTYPYTNFHELNLGYFIVHFREIFSQWADLYDQMLDWKDATTDELAAWKTGVEADLDQREAALRAELETWKAQTGQDIAGWEDATLAALTAWQTATQAVFEAIRVEAAGSASAAAASAGDAATAKTAAETAQAAAEAAAASVQASAAQITTNTGDIADLKTQFENGVLLIYSDLTSWYNGYMTSSGGFTETSVTISPTNAPVKLNNGEKVTVNPGSFSCGLSIYTYNESTQTYTRTSNDSHTDSFDIVSNSNNFYYALTFSTIPQGAVTPDAFDGNITTKTAWYNQIQSNTDRIEELESDTEDNTNKITDIEQTIEDGTIKIYTNLTEWYNGYVTSSGSFGSSSQTITPTNAPVKLNNGEKVTVNPGSFSCGAGIFTYNESTQTYNRTSNNVYTDTFDIESDSDNFYYALTFSTIPQGTVTPDAFDGNITAKAAWYNQIQSNTEKIESNTERIVVLENKKYSYLSGKKLCACGDSITVAANPGGGYFDSYAKIAAERNDMIYSENAISGSTMADVTGRNPFCVDRYLTVTDFDYLTIWFGFNDCTYAQIGTISDTTDETFYGAYKKVLEHFVTTYPTKKIGLIVPYGPDARVPDFQQAVRDVSEMYGVPCLDLADYNKCSLVYGTSNSSRLARRSALTYDDIHPNQTGHEFISTMYEQFLLSL